MDILLDMTIRFTLILGSWS